MLYRNLPAITFISAASMLTLFACGDDETNDNGSGGSSGASTTVGSTNSTTVSSTSSSSSGSGGGMNITCTPGSNSNIPEGECSLLQQNCPEGTGCAPVSDGTTGCVPGGLKDAGMPCASPDECLGGMVCVFDKCAPFCCPENDQPCDGGFCNVNIDYGDGQFAFACSFPDTCTLFQPNQCAANEDCHPNPDKGISTCTQPSSNPVMEGESCEFINDCGDMQLCVSEAGGNVCRYACDVTMAAQLEPGLGGCPDAPVAQTCTAFSGSQIPNLGICGP